MSQTVGKTALAYSRTWHHIDVGSDPRPLGRIASQIAIVLMGKHKPIWDPTDCGDYVVATGCHDLHTTGKKRFQKKYYTHNTRPGSLKEITMDRMFAKWGGGEVLRKAVSGMLPKNRLRDKRLARLKAFEGLAHPYKENIVKFAGETKIAELPKVRKAMLEPFITFVAIVRDRSAHRVNTKESTHKVSAEDLDYTRITIDLGMPPKKAAEPAVRASARVKAVPNALPVAKGKATGKNTQKSAAPTAATKRKTADDDSSSRSVKQTKPAPNTGRKIAPLKATVTKTPAAKTTTKKAAVATAPSKKATAAKAAATKSTAKATSTKRTATEASPVNSTGPTVGKRKATDEDTPDRPVKKANVNGVTGLKASRPFKIPRRGAPSIINKAPIQKLNVYVFGEGGSGELGLGSARTAVDVKRPRLNPNLAADKVGVVQVATGGMHAIALTHDSKILTWGVNDLGAVGRDTKWEGGLRDGSDDDSDDDSDSDSGMNPRESMPTQVPTQYFEEGTKFVQVAAGDSASFAVTDEGYVYGWGTFRNNEGTLGFGPNSLVQFTPTYVPGLKKIKSIAMGNNHALALDHKGTVFAWGSGQQHQLGRRLVERTATGGLVPREFGLPKNKIRFIACGSYHSFAIDNNNKVWAWGANSYCETGIRDGLGADSSVVVKPKIVESLEEYDIEYIVGGDHHSLAVTKDGDLLVWGRLDGFQIGVKVEDIPKDYITYDENGIPRILHHPLKINGLKVNMVAAGSDNNIAITTDGKAYSWGFSANYQTGQGTIEDIEVATLIDNTAVRGKRLTWAGCGGQFSILAAPADDAVMVNGEQEIR